MNIAIDGYEANAAGRVGVGRYAYELILALHKLIHHGAQHHRVTVFVPDAVAPHMPPVTDRWAYIVAKPKRFWTFLGFPMALALQSPRPDVVFSPTHYIPRFSRLPSVAAVMDTSYFVYPDLFRSADLVKLRNGTAYTARHSRKIVTISGFSKRAIISAYGVPESRVEVVYPALRTDSLMEVKPSTLKTFGLTTPYILSVGTLQPRKNYVRLIEAYAKLSPGMPLAIVGKKGWLYEDILAAPEKYGVGQSVKFLEYVKDEDLPALYANAAFFVLASLYEGFGLPVLEAMAHGCPVVVSNVSSLPEIAGDAAIYVDPESAESIGNGMKQALEQAGTPAEAKRKKLGRERVKLFSWEKAAKQVMGILEEAARK